MKRIQVKIIHNTNFLEKDTNEFLKNIRPEDIVFISSFGGDYIGNIVIAYKTEVQ